MEQEKTKKVGGKSRAGLVVALALGVVIFTLLFRAVAPGREVAAVTLPQARPPAGLLASIEEGQAIFEQSCTACHSIGGGGSVGPDLEGVTGIRERDWLIRFIVAPGELIAEDPLAQKLVAEYDGIEMPDMGLTGAEAEAVLAYIEAGSAENEPSPEPVAEEPTPEPEEEEPADTPAEPVPGEEKETPVPASPEPPPTGKPAPSPRGDSGTGRAIFTGAAALENGGAACISCHDVSSLGAPGGGNLAADLSSSYDSYGEPGLASLLENASFPIMKEIYGPKPLTQAEIVHLTAFLQEAGDGEPAPPRNAGVFISIGVAAFLGILVVFQIYWRKRLAGVRRRLVRGGWR